MFYPAGIGPFTALPAGTTANPSPIPVIDLGVPMSNHTLAIVGVGTLTTGAVKLEASLDQVNWYQLVAPVTATVGVAVGQATNLPARYIRANVSTAVTGGGSVTVQVVSSGA